MSNSEFIIPQELKSPTKINKWLYVADLMFIIIYFMSFKVLDVFVDSRLHIFYYIFNIAMAMILTAPSHYNPKKRIYHSLIYMLAKDRTVYHPISPPNMPIIKADLVGTTVHYEKNIYQRLS